MRKLDLHSRSGEKNPGIRSHVLQETPAHLIHRAQDECVCQTSHQLRWQAGTTPSHGQPTETGLVYGHISRQDSLTKIILQGTVKGKQRRGRRMKSWMDNIKDWTKQPTARLLCLVEDQQRWRIMVAKASTVSPQRVSTTVA